MQTAEYSTTSELHAKAQMLGALLDDFARMIKQPDTAVPAAGGFTELRNKFDASLGLAKSLLVVKVRQSSSTTELSHATSYLENQTLVTKQLKEICGQQTPVAAIGDDEYAVLLLGYDQCGELIPRLENLVARIRTTLFSDDDSAQQCHIGVARTPIDTEDLQTAIVMASAAASELTGTGPSFQYICRRHRVCVS